MVMEMQMAYSTIQIIIYQKTPNGSKIQLI
nr:MAG TPA: hypothetical protein [Caudoviricetes sp.]